MVERHGLGNRTADTINAFGSGLLHGAIESPINGVTQLANRGLDRIGLHIDPIEISGLSKANLNSPAERAAAQGGTAIGAIVPLMLISKATGKFLNAESMAAQKTAEILGTKPMAESIKLAAKQGFVTGAIYGGVFTPSADGDQFLKSRLQNATLGGTTFATFQAANQFGRNVLSSHGLFGSLNTRQFLTREMPLATAVGALAGVPTGLVSAVGQAKIERGSFAPTAAELRNHIGSNVLFGGAFAGLHQVQMRFTKAAPLTQDQIDQIRWAQRTNGETKSWEPAYDQLFPAAEAQDKGVLHANFNGEPPVADRPQIGQPKMTLHETTAPNGKWLAGSINEIYPGRPSIPGEKGFVLGAYTFVHPEMQSTGIGAYHLKNGVIPALKTEFPAAKFQGRLTEIEATDGLTADAQPVRRARFYRDKIGMVALDKNKFPYELPLFQPGEAAEAGTYIPQRQIPEWAKSKGIADAGEGPVPAEMLYTSFDGQPVTGQQARSMYDRLARWGYGVEAKDPYLVERTQLIDGTATDLRTPIQINPEPPEPLSFLPATMKAWRGSRPGQMFGDFVGRSNASGAITTGGESEK